MGKLDKLEPTGAAGNVPHLFWHASQVTAQARTHQAGQQAATVWLTGLSGAGKSTLACALEKKLMAAGHMAYAVSYTHLTLPTTPYV